MVAVPSTPLAASASSSAPTDATLPTCPCGHNRHHHRVSRDGEYRTWAWLLLMWGISVEPLKVTWRCRLCNTSFDESRDPSVLARRV